MLNQRHPGIPTGPQEVDLYRCVHCGLCLNHCPTYLETGLETESPRGRIQLMKAVREGRLELTPRVVGHFELCVQCRACEDVCPSGVPYGRMMEATRAQVRGLDRDGWLMRLIDRLLYDELLPHFGRLGFAARLLALYQVTSLPSLVVRLLPKQMAEMHAMLPEVDQRQLEPSYPASGMRRGRVALLEGCVMPLFFGVVNEATVRVLTRNGFEVVVPRLQTCCGALHVHRGHREQARALARRTIAAFLESGAHTIVVNSAGCGAMLKEYGELLHDDPEYAEKATQFSSLVRDISEFLVEQGFEPPGALPETRVTYQESCHLSHAQRVKEPPRQVLGAIPGLELVEMRQADVCCGSGGVYALLQPEMSLRILESKMEAVAHTGASLVATANPGCLIQLQAGMRRVGLKGRVVHVVELLDEAYAQERGEMAYSDLATTEAGPSNA